MFYGKEIAISIKKHFGRFGLNESEFFSPLDSFNQRWMTVTYREMLEYRAAILQKFVCHSDDGQDLNPLALNLREFMEQNSDLYSHPCSENVAPNCKMVEIRINQMQIIFRHEVQAKLKLERPELLKKFESVLERLKDELMDMCIQDFRNEKINLNVKF